MKKVLITGCAGFVGNVLVRDLLAKGYQVRGLDNLHKGHCDALLSIIDNPGFEFQYGDVAVQSDVIKAVKGVDAIIHLAAIVGLPACRKQPELAKIVNIKGTENIVMANPE